MHAALLLLASHGIVARRWLGIWSIEFGGSNEANGYKKKQWKLQENKIEYFYYRKRGFGRWIGENLLPPLERQRHIVDGDGHGPIIMKMEEIFLL